MKSLHTQESKDNESVFMISCIKKRVNKQHQPPKGNTETKGTETLALVNTKATVNVMDMVIFDELGTCPIVRHTNANIHSHRSTTLLALRGVTEATV